MADANALRQRRHDACLRTITCPRCGAWVGRECHEVVNRGNGYFYPRNLGLMPPPAQRVTRGPDKIGRFDWGREIGGLHAARWVAWAGLDAVTRLGDVLGRTTAEESRP